MTKLGMKFWKFLCLGIMVGSISGCYSSPKEVRDEATTRASFVSSKPPEVLAGCIAEAWTDGPIIARTDRTAKGWAVTQQAGGAVLLAVADVVADGKQSTVNYSSTFTIISRRDKIPAIERCL